MSSILSESKSRHNQDLAVAVVALVALLVAPQVLYPIFLANFLCFALFASAFNLLLGYGGLLSFGHAAYFGWAAYISAHVAREWGFPPEAAILSGTIVAAGLGLGIGALAIRRQGIYFAMVTLAMAQMLYLVALKAPLTHGEDGIQAVPRGILFGFIDLSSNENIYYLVLGVFLIGFAIIYRTVHSPFGQILVAIRENEPRAISLGYRVNHYKLLAFTLSAALVGLAGATKTLVFQLASLNDVTWQMSGEVVLITLVGGVGTIYGPVVGALIIITMNTYLAAYGDWVTGFQGLIFVLTVLTFRKGVVGEIRDYVKRLQGEKISVGQIGGH